MTKNLRVFISMLLLINIFSSAKAFDPLTNLQTGFPAHPFKNITPYLGGKACGTGWNTALRRINLTYWSS